MRFLVVGAMALAALVNSAAAAAVVGYEVTGSPVLSPAGLSLDLSLIDAVGPAFYGTDISQLKVDVSFQTADRIRVKIYDPNQQRWEIPSSLVPDGTEAQQVQQPTQIQDQLNYKFSYTVNPFGFAVTRVPDGEVLFNTSVVERSLVFEDQYIEISSILPKEPNIFGLGERVDTLRLNNSGKIYTMWTSDAGTPPSQNLYGVHPFYLDVREGGMTHGVWLRNSNGMEVQLNEDRITYYVIGGVLDFFVFVGGPQPEIAVKQYHDVVGFPYMPNFWTLGWHQCRWGTTNLSVLETVVQKYAENNIPLETVWSDIDYMDQHHDYSWDPVNFPEDQIKTFVAKLHSNDQHYVVIVDPGIPYLPGADYAPYDTGVEANVFVRNSTGDIFVGKVWPGLTAFPDFLHPNSSNYWFSQISQFLDQVPIDGLWIDMNECSNFCNGQCNLTTQDDLRSASENAALPYGPNNPPYKINHLNSHAPLNTKTFDMDAVHYGGILDYDVHNMYGYTESIVTKDSLEKYYGKRAFVLSRSTFSGSGKHTAHWLGDNYSTYPSMQGSIVGAILMNIFGIPMVGADICGFVFSTTEQLCAKWHAWGAYYPFSRNHNIIGAIDQYPYVWDSVKNALLKNLLNKYSITSYYYTLFFQAHKEGGTVVRPLFFEFPSDSNTYDLNYQFMIGSALMFAPDVVENATSVEVYLPAATWYDWWTGSLVSKNLAQTISVNTPWGYVPIFAKGGSIIFKRSPELTLANTLKNSLEIIVALDDAKSAQGELFIDDGTELDVGKFATYVSLNAQGNTIHSQVICDLYNGQDVSKLVSKISVWGVDTAPTSVFAGGESANFEYDSTNGILHVELTKPLPVTAFEMNWA